MALLALTCLGECFQLFRPDFMGVVTLLRGICDFCARFSIEMLIRCSLPVLGLISSPIEGAIWRTARSEESSDGLNYGMG